MEEELVSLHSNNTWDLALAPANHLLVGSKWVYSIKLKADGSLDRYKARLVAQVYMRPPPGYHAALNLLCKLKKALYGLKQAPRACDNKDGIQYLKDTLQSSFHMKDLGLASYFLGLEISKNSQGYFLSQRKYPHDLIKLAQLSDAKTVATPLQLNVNYGRDDGDPLLDPMTYRSIVGGLVYLTVTRPDIAHAVHIVSQFVSDLRCLHLTAVHHIIRYLRSTSHMGLSYATTSASLLTAYSDADYAGCKDTCRV
ncbi:uncharacterized mitochondrial protein AtMg00810-like [Phoenix dactylifera]|uniref:Uncharacterized mitochondrial protein AtMg00810-like n=1 Tax=Phoenix dactylifera TaxID=42345 RepID=A0A8B7MUS2_PHODC|nr:uncharacterized mitochondrial protein AtMg00810-like [Phoenix dactylifera]